jgi:hypothetical protein
MVLSSASSIGGVCPYYFNREVRHHPRMTNNTEERLRADLVESMLKRTRKAEKKLTRKVIVS